MFWQFKLNCHSVFYIGIQVVSDREHTYIPGFTKLEIPGQLSSTSLAEKNENGDS